MHSMIMPSVGYKFRPTDIELLSFLRLKVTGQQLPPILVVEKALYGNNAEPWKVFSADDPWDDETGNGSKHTKIVVYVFTKLSRMSANRVSRIAGCGTWEAQAKGRVILNNRSREVIGSMKTLNFVLNSGSEEIKGGWIMHEYSLSGVGLTGIGSTDDVICKITRDDEKYTKMKYRPSVVKRGLVAAAAKDEGEVQESITCSANPECFEVLGKRLRSFQQENSPPKKMPRNNVAEDRSIYGDDHFSLESSDETIRSPDYFTNNEGPAINPSPQAMCVEAGMNGQTTCPDMLLGFEVTDQPTNLIASDGYDFRPNDMPQYTASLDGRLLQELLAFQYSVQSFDQDQTSNQITCQPVDDVFSKEVDDWYNKEFLLEGDDAATGEWTDDRAQCSVSMDGRSQQQAPASQSTASIHGGLQQEAPLSKIIFESSDQDQTPNPSRSHCEQAVLEDFCSEEFLPSFEAVQMNGLKNTCI